MVGKTRMDQENITRPSTPILMGFNSNEGFLTLMQFLTKEFPTEKLHTEGFSRQMAMKMIAKMFPSMPPQSHKVNVANKTRQTFGQNPPNLALILAYLSLS